VKFNNQTMMKKVFYRMLLVVILIPLTSCVQVKGYQMMYLNDEDMNLVDGSAESFEQGFQNYREGASGANGSKVGGDVDAIKNIFDIYITRVVRYSSRSKQHC